MAFKPRMVSVEKQETGGSYLKVTLIKPILQIIHLQVTAIVARWHNIYYCDVLWAPRIGNRHIYFLRV